MHSYNPVEELPVQNITYEGDQLPKDFPIEVNEIFQGF